jgi:WD40 repeat protein
MMLLEGHEGIITSAKFNIDGTRVVTASVDKTARVWDSDTGAELMRFVGHEDSLNVATFSEDGSRLLTASDDKTIRQWRVSSGEQEYLLFKHSRGAVYAAYCAQDKRVLGVDQKHGSVLLWDLASERLIVYIEAHGPQSLSLTEDKLAFATGGRDGLIRVWNAESGDEIKTLKCSEGGLGVVRISPNGQRILAASARFEVKGDYDILILSSGNGKELCRLIGHSASVVAAEFSDDGDRVVTCSHDRSLRLWDALSGQQIANLGLLVEKDNFPGTRDSMSFAPFASKVVSLWDSNSAAVFETVDRGPIARIGNEGEKITGLAIDPDGTRVAAAREKDVSIYDIATGEKLARLAGDGPRLTRIAFSPDGSRLLSGSYGSASLWDLSRGSRILGEIALQKDCKRSKDQKTRTHLMGQYAKGLDTTQEKRGEILKSLESVN